jgi:hypothetical protein
MNHDRNIAELSLSSKAELALQAAVRNVIEAHRRTGEPLVIWRDGCVVRLAPDKAMPPQIALP